MTTMFSMVSVIGFIMVFGSMIFGHDDDGSHFDDDHDGDGHEGSGSISIFSFKVIGSFLIGFGSTGALSVWVLKVSNFTASAIGMIFGLLMGFFGWWLLTLINKQQANSIVSTDSLIGQNATVTLDIDAYAAGEVALTYHGTYMTKTARNPDGIKIKKGEMVKIVQVVGSDVFVKKENQPTTGIPETKKVENT